MNDGKLAKFMPKPAALPNFQVANVQHIGRRERQEDSFGFSRFDDAEFVEHGGIVCIVADGMGGLEFGLEASTIAVKEFLAAYRQKSPRENVTDALNRAAHAANAKVFAAACNAGLQNRMGSTLVGLALLKNRAYWIGIGDSRLYLCHAGVIRCITEDHHYRAELQAQVKNGALTEREADEHPKAHALTSYLGREKIPQINTSPTEGLALVDSDWLLLCSDGLSGALSEAEIGNCLHGTPAESARHLLDGVLKKGNVYQDNTTILLLRRDDLGRFNKPSSIERQQQAKINKLPSPIKLPVQPAKQVMANEQESTGGNKNALVIFLLIILLLVSAGAWWKWKDQDLKPAPASNSTSTLEGGSTKDNSDGVPVYATPKAGDARKDDRQPKASPKPVAEPPKKKNANEVRSAANSSAAAAPNTVATTAPNSMAPVPPNSVVSPVPNSVVPVAPEKLEGDKKVVSPTPFNLSTQENKFQATVPESKLGKRLPGPWN